MKWWLVTVGNNYIRILSKFLLFREPLGERNYCKFGKVKSFLILRVYLLITLWLRWETCFLYRAIELLIKYYVTTEQKEQRLKNWGVMGEDVRPVRLTLSKCWFGTDQYTLYLVSIIFYIITLKEKHYPRKIKNNERFKRHNTQRGKHERDQKDHARCRPIFNYKKINTTQSYQHIWIPKRKN